jgi:hypothetical protein
MSVGNLDVKHSQVVETTLLEGFEHDSMVTIALCNRYTNLYNQRHTATQEIRESIESMFLVLSELQYYRMY